MGFGAKVRADFRQGLRIPSTGMGGSRDLELRCSGEEIEGH